MAKIENVSESAIQEFWTDHPMILPGIDVKSATPEQIFEFMEKSTREKAPQLQKPGQGLFSNYFDFESYRDKTILEIGFGTGLLLNEFVKVGAKVHGIDLSKSHFELSKYRFRDDDVDLLIASAEKIPHEDNSFDLVNAYGVLHHSQNDEQCYSEVLRVLKPGGRAFLMVYRKGGPQYYYHKIFKQGILRGGLIKSGFNMTRFINSMTDAYTDDSPGAPVSRYYVRSDIDHLFRYFSQVKVEVTGTLDEWAGIPAYKLPISDWLLNTRMRIWLLSHFGSFYIINLIK
jgi:SAM-dependent methyltransferase